MARRFDPAADSYGVEVSSPRELSASAIGTLRVVTGSVTVKRAGTIAQASNGDSLYQGDVIETGADGSVAISFIDGNAFYLRPGTIMVLDEFVCGVQKSNSSALFRILKGAFVVIAGKLAKSGRLIIETPFGQIRCSTPGAGFGTVAFGILTFSLVSEAKAFPYFRDILSDAEIDFNYLKHGAFEIVLFNGRHIVVDRVDQGVWIYPNG